MIRLVYSKQRLWNAYQAIWCSLIFLINNLIFFYVILKICFDSFVSRPPWQLSMVLLIFLLADVAYTPYATKNICNVTWLVDLLAWILVLLSFYLPDQATTSYLGLAISFRIYDAIYFKEMLFDMVKRSYWAYKICIVVKIVYMMIIYGHVIGCIFYAVEMYLLDRQVFGPIELYPDNYYQGQLLAYTPILMFEDLNRYVYAIYYSFALISTIAFGDIIGKNYIQDAYVMVLILLSTIGIALIIQQMYMVFRRKKTKYLLLLNQIRFLSERLKQYDQIPKQFRTEIINYLIETNWKYMNQQPVQLERLPQLKQKLIRQSIINSKLPSLFEKYMLSRLILTNYPAEIQLSFNSPQLKQLSCYFVVNGTFWIGYQMGIGKFAGGYQAKYDGNNFGVEQCLVGTNSLYPWLCIRTVTSGLIFTMSYETIHQILAQISVIQCPYDYPVEHYQIAKDNALFKREKYICSVCQVTNHTLIDCPKCHLVINAEQAIHLINRKNLRSIVRRKPRKSNKITNLSLSQYAQNNGKEQVIGEILKLKKQIAMLRVQFEEKFMDVQKWHNWNMYKQVNEKE